MKCHAYHRFFQTISNRLRIDILMALKRKSMSVGELCAAVHENQSTVSHSLTQLRSCHLIEARREGKRRIYSLNHETITPMLSLIERHVATYCSQSCARQP